MKTKTTMFCATLLLAAVISNAAEPANTPTPPPGVQIPERKDSAEFARMKSLVGTWTGKADMGQGPIEMTVQYRVLAGGSVLEERCFIGTPMEMVSMYYDQNGKLAMTHYCMMGNRPGMVLNSSDAKTIRFDFDKTCGIDPSKESHMHALSITFDDADTFTSSCRAFMDGKEVKEHPVTMKRLKSS